MIPSNVEKSFDQVSRAVSWISEHGTFPVIIGGDHSLGFPDVRGIAPHIDGNIGIIHLDRHIDIQERDMDERMHTTPWFHATRLGNVPAVNLVQVGIGGWYGSRPGLKVARERNTTVLTIGDVERLGVERTAEVALELAWKDASAVFLSLDIDVVDGGFTPGTGSPEPGGLLPREMLKLIRLVAREGLAGMELVEICPPNDVSDMTAQLGCRAILDVLATLVDAGHLGRRKKSASAHVQPAEHTDA